MKSLSCFIFKIRMERFLDAPNSPGWFSSHLNHCAECRINFESEQKVVRCLKMGQKLPEPSQYLKGRIISELRRQSVPKRNPFPSWGLVMGSLALVVSITATKLVLKPDVSTRSLLAHTPSAGTPSPKLNLPGIDFSKLSHSLETPMEQERKALINDGKAALHQLAQNFVLTAYSPDSQE